MKATWRITAMLAALLMLLSMNAGAATPASLNQRMATRSGPGTQYTEELGTMPQNTDITLIEMVTTNGTPWGLVEFYKNGMRHRAYTGMKRINAYGPVARGTLDYYEIVLSQSSEVYYGPGYNYAQRQKRVPAGSWLRVYDSENGFTLCDYQQDGKWVRGYLPGIPQGGQSYTEPAPQPSYSYSYGTPASLNQRMATRSGPGTQYTEELGTMPQETAITLIEYVTTGVPWGLVEFYRNGQKVRAYTGMKRINAYGPVAQGTQDYYELSLSQSTDVYYGPGYDYARRAESVGRGTLLRVYGYENGFAICDYKRGTSWVRAYFPVI